MRKKKGMFRWTKAASKAFTEIKAWVTEAPMMRLLVFFKVFEVAWDVWGVHMGGVLSQEGHPLSYFSKKLKELSQKYSTFNKESYIVVQALRYWRHYLLL